MTHREFKIMAKFKVRYNDGRMQPIAADSWSSSGDNWLFTLDGREIAIIAKKNVESITDEDVPDAEHPAPFIG